MESLLIFLSQFLTKGLGVENRYLNFISKKTHRVMNFFFQSVNPLTRTYVSADNKTALQRKSLQYVIFIFAAFVLSLSAKSQNNGFLFPVQVQTVAMPPYSPYLDDYTLPGRLQVKVVLTDPVKDKLKVRLGLSMISTKFTLEPNWGPQSLTLEITKGIPVILTPEDLKILFKDANTKNYPSEGKIPEDAYLLNVLAVDASDESLPVSNPFLGSQSILILQGQPPILNLPMNNAQVSATAIPNILFQWTPRNLQTFVPNTNGPILYNFKLLDLGPIGSSLDPNNAFADPQAIMQSNVAGQGSSRIVVNEKVAFPYYHLIQTSLPFEVNHRYAWNVEIVEPVEGKTYFGERKASEVHVFDYIGICPEPVSPKATIDPGTGKIILTWFPPVQTDINNPIKKYAISVKKSNGEGNDPQPFFFTPTGFAQQFTLSLPTGEGTNKVPDLVPNTQYQFYVQTECATSVSATPTYAGAGTYVPKECSEGPQQIVVSNSTSAEGAKEITWENIPAASHYSIKTETSPSVYDYISVTGANKIIGTSFVFTPEEGKKYYLYATCSNGEQKGEEFTSVNGFQGTCAAPDPVNFKGVYGSSKENTNFTLSWNGSRIYQSYTFTYKATNDASFTEVAGLTGAMVQLMLDPAKEYIYQITYVCGEGKSFTTPQATFKPSSVIPIEEAPRTGDCFPPVNLVSEVKSSSEVALAWDKIAGAKAYQLFYILQKSFDADPKSTWTMVDNISRNRHTLSGLAPGIYYYHIKVLCEGASAEPSVKSENHTFDLNTVPDVDGACSKVTDIELSSVTNNELNVKWSKVATHSSYQLRFHNIDDPITTWYTLDQASIILPTSETGEVQASIRNLKAGKSYEIELTAFCGTNIKGNKSAIVTFQTTPAPPATEGDFQCGQNDPDNAFDLGSCGQLRPTAGGKFFAAGFEVIATSPTAGKCLLPYANYAEAKLRFENVELDANSRLCRGRVVVEAITVPAAGKLAERLTSFQNEMNNAINTANEVLDGADIVLTEAQKYFEGGDNVGKVKTGEGIKPDIDLTNSETQVDPSKNYHSNGTITIDGKSATSPAIIQDKSGSLYFADEKGTKEVGKSVDKPADDIYQYNFSKGNLVFSKGSDEFAFDAFDIVKAQSAVVAKEYKAIPLDAPTLRVPIQFSMEKRVVTVNAKLSAGNSLITDNISFINKPKEGKAIKYQSDYKDVDGDGEKEFVITLLGGPAADAQEIYAIYTDGEQKYCIGELFLPSYEKVKRKVELISIGDKDLGADYKAAVQERLDDIYKPIGVEWTVTQTSVFNDQTWDINGDGKLQESGAGKFSNDYTGEERALVQAFLKSRFTGKEPDKQTAYLFVLDEIANKSSADLLGKMPHQEQVGFIYVGTGTKNLQDPLIVASTVTHELGHGAFFLEHPFERNIGFQKDGLTNNLLDYPAGNELWKFQWDRIHDPGHIWGIFRRDDEAKLATLTIKELEGFANPDKTYTFISPAGKIITLPSNITSMSFSTGDNWETSKEIVAAGTLVSFTTNEGIFSVTGDVKSKSFSFYQNKNGVKYKDVFSKDQDIALLKPIIGIPCYDNGVNQFRVTKVDYKNASFEKDREKEEYYAEGNYASFDFLFNRSVFLENKYVKLDREIGTSKYVLARLKTLNAEAQQFIAIHSTEANCSSGASSYFVYTHAQQISNYPNVFRYCASNFRLDDPEYLLTPDIANYDPIVYLSTTAVPDKSLFVPKSPGANLIYRNPITPSVYSTINDRIEAILNSLKNKFSIEEIKPILDNIEDYECVLNSIDIGVRLSILEDLIADGTDKYILVWLRNTPKNQQKSVVEYFVNNKSKLKEAYNNLTSSELDEFINLISNWYLEQNDIDKNKYKDFVPPPVISQSNTTNYFRLNDYGLDGVDYSGGTLKEGNISSSYTNEIFIKNFYKVYNEGKEYSSTWTYTTVKPFDLVILEASVGFDNYSRTFKTGDRILVPAIYAHWMIRRYNQDRSWKKVSLAVETISLLASLGESSIVVASIEATVASTNIYVLVNENELKKSSDGETFVTLWNAFDLTYNVGSHIKTVANTKHFNYVYSNVKSKFASQTTTANKNKFILDLSNISTAISKLAVGSSNVANNIFLSSKKFIEQAYSLKIADLSQIANNNYQTAAQWVGNELKAIVVGMGINYGVATSKLQENGDMLLTYVNWAKAGEKVTRIGDIKEIKYVDKDGNEIFGTLEVVKGDLNIVYLRKPLEWLSDWDESLKSTLKADINSSPTLEKLFEDASLAHKIKLSYAWKALSGFSNLRKISNNLEVLARVGNRFTYNGKIGFDALADVFDGHVSVQKFIENLDKADKYFAGISEVTLSGIKSSSEARLLTSTGIKIGKVDNTLVPFEFLETGEPIGKAINNIQLVKDGTKYGFKVNNDVIVEQLTQKVKDHIHIGEVSVSIKNNTGQVIYEKTFPANEVYYLLKQEVEQNNFIQILKQGATPSVMFTGLHNYDNFIKNSSVFRQNPLNPVPRIIGSVDGKTAYILEPEVKLPDFDDLRKTNKWTAKEKWYPKQKTPVGRISSCFLEGMSESEIEKMVSDAFKVKVFDGESGREWFGKINYFGSQVIIRGYLDKNDNISSAFIESIK